MVILIRIPSFAYCVLHNGPYKSASWIHRVADCKVCYAALRADALEKSATTTLSVAFNLVCPLITENSSRTRNPDLPITASKPVHPHVLFSDEDGSARKWLRLMCFNVRIDSINDIYLFIKSLIFFKSSSIKYLGLPSSKE